ncbi:hypothetical protein KAI04_01820 [Candidatus Pacearchaeota archaeon]|nr:hypothetical protein [Candidatus Pacearchaeota archaeon]
MKKSVSLSLICFSFILVLCLSLISAGWFFDLFKKAEITGEVVVDDWTDWLNRDGPTGSGDWEQLSSHIAEKGICENPIEVECQTITGLDYSETGEVVSCSVTGGLVCANTNQPDGICNFDYKVRFNCGSEEVTPESEEVISDLTPRVSFWPGKVNQHTEDGVWKTDPDKSSGAVWGDTEDLRITYCNKLYEETIVSSPEYGSEIISFCIVGTTTCIYEGTRMTYSCLDAEPENLDFSSLITCESCQAEKGVWCIADEGEGEDWCASSADACEDGDGDPMTFCSDCPDGDADSDYPNGLNYYKKGFYDGVYDDCSSKEEDKLIEYYCGYDLEENSKRIFNLYDCPNGCLDGACVPQKSSCDITGENSGTCILYEGETLYVGSKMIELLFITPYKVKLGIDLQTTENLSELETQDMGDYKVDIINIISQDYVDGVNYVTFKIEESNLGGSGGSAGEIVEVNSAEECTSGCFLDGKCYNIGYRKGLNYCNEEQNFEIQKEGDVSCEENSECLSNVCIDGNCIKEGVWKQFMVWFGKLFGGGGPDYADIDYFLEINDNFKGNLTGTVNIAFVEFVLEPNLNSNLFYEFYCNNESCKFRSPEQEKNYFVNFCGEDCFVFNVTFFEMLNNPFGVTNILDLTGREVYSYPSLYQIESFYEGEAKRYGKNLNLEIDILGPYFISEVAPVRGRSGGGFELNNFFHFLKSEMNLNLSKYGVVNYVYFGNESSYPFVSTASGNETFNGFSISIDGLFGYVNTISHEMGHEFTPLGSGEGYEKGGRCIFPYYYVEPNKIPLFPQNFGCVMCGSIMDNNNSRSPIWNLNLLKICNHTAFDLGWIKEPQWSGVWEEINEFSYRIKLYEKELFINENPYLDSFDENLLDFMEVNLITGGGILFSFFGNSSGLLFEGESTYYSDPQGGDFFYGFHIERINFEEGSVIFIVNILESYNLEK